MLNTKYVSSDLSYSTKFRYVEVIEVSKRAPSFRIESIITILSLYQLDLDGCVVCLSNMSEKIFTQAIEHDMDFMRCVKCRAREHSPTREARPHPIIWKKAIFSWLEDTKIVRLNCLFTIFIGGGRCTCSVFGNVRVWEIEICDNA